MKKLLTALAALALSFGAIAIAVPAGAVAQYQITIETKGEAATVTAYSPQNQAIRMTVTVDKNSTKKYALEAASYYEFSMVICGQTRKSRWNYFGSGVVLAIDGCSSYSFSAQR